MGNISNNNKVLFDSFIRTRVSSEIQFLSGLCGSGKTYSIHQDLVLNYKKFILKKIIVVPTKTLAAEYKKTFQKNGITNYFICDRNNYPSAKKAFKKHFEENTHSDKSCVIVTTCSTFNSIVNEILGLHNISNWDLILDEIPQVDTHYEPNIPYNTHLLTDLIEVDKQLTLDLYIMKFKFGVESKVTELLARNSDDVDNIYKPIIRAMFNKELMLFDVNNWDKLTELKIIDKDPEDMTYGNELNKFYAISFKTPEKVLGWKSTLMMGANFKSSMLYDVWSNQLCVDFVESALTKTLRYSEHENGANHTFLYMSDIKWSKYQASKFNEDSGKTLEQEFLDKAILHFKDEPVLSFFNNSSTLELPDNWEKAPIVCHGLNRYDRYKNVYFSPALNRTPKHIAMLKSFGISEETIIISTICEYAYQASYRSAARNPLNNEIITTVFLDKRCAEFMAKLHIGSKIGQLGEHIR